MGIYELDENNGIILPMNYKGHILSSLFQLGNSFLITRMEFNGKYWCMSKSLFLIDFQEDLLNFFMQLILIFEFHPKP
jgi:hypothetical protein